MTVQAHHTLRRGIWLFVFVLVLLVFPVVAQDAQKAAIEGDAHAGKGEWAEALADYRHAVALDPRKADYRARLGTALGKVGESDEALLEFLEGLRLDPASSLIYESLGDYYLGLTYWNASEVSYSNAVKLSAGDAQARHRLGIALAAQDKFDEAASAFSEAVRLAPANPEHLYGLGKVQTRRQKWKEAEANFRLALKKSSEEAFKVRCVNSLGNLFLAQNRLANAEQEFRKAASLDPKDGRSLANLAAALYRRGSREEAWQTAQRALRLGYAGPHEIYTELGIDPQPVVFLTPLIRENRGVHPSDSELLAAVVSQDVVGVRAALAAGADPEAREDTKRAIEIAAVVGDASTIETLLDHGAHGDAATSGGDAPLVLAVRSGNLNAVSTLLSAGVDTECGPEGSALLVATQGQTDDLSVEIVRALVQAGAEVNVRHKGTGLTPLMWAAQSDSIELVKLLIDAGADAGVQDLTRKTAFDHAQNKGKDDTARLLHPFTSSAAPEAPGDSIRLAPGGDLLAASRAARSGQTIVLRAGKYFGPIYVEGKTLTIIGDPEGGSVIVAHPGGKARLMKNGDPYVFVNKDSNLDLWNIRFDKSPASNGAALLQDGAALRLESCVFENLSKTVCIAQKGRLFISNSRFENLTAPEAIVLNESTAIVRGTQFKNLKHTCIQAGGGSTLSVVNSTFTRARMGASVFDRSIIRISHCEFTDVDRGLEAGEVDLVSVRDSQFAEGTLAFIEKSDRIVLRRNTLGNVKIAPESNAIYLQDSRGILVADNRIEGFSSAIVARDGTDGPVALARNTIRRTYRAIVLAGKSKGDRPAALITGNRVLGFPFVPEKKMYGVLADGEMHVVLSGNTILRGSFGNAVFLQANATARFVGNLLSATDAAIYFYETSSRKSTLARELLIGGNVKTYQSGAGPVRRSGTEKLDAFVQWSPHAGLLRRVIFEEPDSADLSDEDLGAFLSRVDKEWEAAVREASVYGTVRLEVRDRIGRRGMLPFKVYDRQSPPGGFTTFTLDQVVAPGQLVRKWKVKDLDSIKDPIERSMERYESTDKVLIYLRKNARRTTRRIVAAHDEGSELSEMLVLSIVTEFNRFLDSGEFVGDVNSKEDAGEASLHRSWIQWKLVHEGGGSTPTRRKREYGSLTEGSSRTSSSSASPSPVRSSSPGLPHPCPRECTLSSLEV